MDNFFVEDFLEILYTFPIGYTKVLKCYRNENQSCLSEKKFSVLKTIGWNKMEFCFFFM